MNLIIENILIYDRLRDNISSSSGNGGCFYFHDIAIEFFENDFVINRPFFGGTSFFFTYRDPVLFAAKSFGSLCELLRIHDTNIKIDTDYVAAYLQFQCPFTSRTIIKSVSQLRCGETVRINFQGELVEQAFADAVTEDGSQTIEFGDRLLQIFRAMDISGYAFHISSGLDSTILAHLASDLVSAPIKLLTCKTLGRGATDELPVVERFAESINADLDVFDYSDIDIFAEGWKMLDCLTCPIGHPSHLLEFLLDREAKRAGFAGVVSGRGPDEYLGGYPWHMPKYGDRHLHRDRLTVTPYDELAAWFRPKVADSALSNPTWKVEQPLTLTQRLVHDIRTISQSWDHIHDAFAQGLSLRISCPFMDAAVRRSFFYMPDTSKVTGQNQKVALRRRFEGEYPSYIVDNPKRGLRIDLRPYILRYSPNDVTDAIFNSSDFGTKYLNKRKVHKIVDELYSGQANWGWQIWSLYLVSLSYALLRME